MLEIRQLAHIGTGLSNHRKITTCFWRIVVNGLKFNNTCMPKSIIGEYRSGKPSEWPSMRKPPTLKPVQSQVISEERGF